MRPRFLLFAFLCSVVCASTAHAQDRGGFTFLATLGYGLQSNGEITVGDNYTEDVRHYGGGTYSSWAGLNLGIGGFVSRNTALMLRLSGTSFTAKYLDQNRTENETDVVSGVVVFDVQHWITDRVNLEGGVGYGLYSTEVHEEFGLGLLLGAAYSFFQRGKISLQVGIEDGLFVGHNQTVNNLGFCFGLQVL